MRHLYLRVSLTLIFMLTGMLGASPALADKPSWDTGEKGGKNKSKAVGEGYEGRGDTDRGESYNRNSHDGHGDRYRSQSHDRSRHRYFNEQQRSFIHDYYAKQYRRGGCPPGLAKKHNGCMPPGQAKKWAMGRRLPRDVIFHDLPSSLLVQLGPAPSGHRYVRVAQDILLITVGTGMVVDALDDLSWEFGR